MSQLVAALDSTQAFVSAPAGPGGVLRVEAHGNLQLRPEDVERFDALVDERPEVGVFVSRQWLSGFFAEREQGSDNAVLLLRHGAALRAVVPVAIRESLTHARVRLLGGGLGSDRVDLLAARGFEAAAADSFLLWLRETFGVKGFVLELRDVCAGSPLWGAIQRTGIERTQRLALQPREIYTLPYLSLQDSGPALAADAPPAMSVRSLLKHRRWLERRCRLRVELLDTVDDVTEAFELLARFLNARWRGHRHGSVLDDPRLERFHRHVLPLLLEAGRLKMMRLSADSRPVAVFYGLKGSRWWGYYLAGYDREWAGRIHLGQVNLGVALDLALRDGAAEFDFLKGAERIKYAWPVRERSTLDADVFSQNSVVQLARATRATRDATAALGKSARALFRA